MSRIAMTSSREQRKSPENKALASCSICMLEDPPAHPSPVTHEYPDAECVLRCLFRRVFVRVSRCSTDRRIHRSRHCATGRHTEPTHRRETRREIHRRLHRSGRCSARCSDRPPRTPCVYRASRTATRTPAHTAMRVDERVGFQKAVHPCAHHDAYIHGQSAMRIAELVAMQVAGHRPFQRCFESIDDHREFDDCATPRTVPLATVRCLRSVFRASSPRLLGVRPLCGSGGFAVISGPAGSRDPTAAGRVRP